MVMRCLYYLVYFMCRLFRFTYRYKYTGIENLHKAMGESPHGSFVMTVWHEHALSGILSQGGEPYAVLVSPSKDGALVDFVCRRFGQIIVRGSSSRGGLEARQEMLTLLRKGTPTSITVDGPKGPRRKCKAGAVDLARETGSPIVPVVAVCSNPWVFKKSWDQHKLPRFFSKLIFSYGECIYVPDQTTPETFKQYLIKVEEGINDLERKALGDLQNWDQLPRRREEIHLSNFKC